MLVFKSLLKVLGSCQAYGGQLKFLKFKFLLKSLNLTTGNRVIVLTTTYLSLK